MKCIFLFASVLLLNSVVGQQIIAHAHNDYENERPLWEALENNFQSIEIDVYQHKGEIKVSHLGANLGSQPTFKSLYLEPLVIYLKEHPDHQLWLLVDLKQGDTSLLHLLHEEVRPYNRLFKSRKSPDERPLQIILSGSVNRALIAQSDRYEYFYLDGRLQHLEIEQWDSDLMPLVSANLSKVVKWNGKEEMHETAQQRIRELVQIAKSQGKKLRFWKTRDTVFTWTQLSQLGVEVIGTDDITGLAAFIQQRN